MLVAATVTALATGLGALPFVFARHPGRSWLAVANALAAGCMVGASLGLVWEGRDYGTGRVAAGAVAGAIVLALTRVVLRHRPMHLEGIGSVDAARMLMIVGVMTVHSFTEGIGVGVSFGGGEALGLFIAAAIAVHNIPEGLAISLVLIPRGVSVGRAAAWSVFSSLPQPLMALPAFLFVETFAPLLPLGLRLRRGRDGVDGRHGAHSRGRPRGARPTCRGGGGRVDARDGRSASLSSVSRVYRSRR